MPDSREEERLVSDFQGLALWIAREFYLPGADRDDVKQEAMIGLLRAIRTYDPARPGARSRRSFYGYAIRCHMISAMKTANRLKHLPLNTAAREERLSDGEVVSIADQIADDRYCPEASLLRRTDLRATLAGLDELTTSERDAIGVHLSSESYAEGAARLGRSEKSIDNGVQRTRQKIAARLAA